MNTKKGLIGVIVPVYKVEKYIAECIESILAQTYTNFRLILVDDGTPDNAGKICDEYAKKDSRITVIHQENAGVTRARARGVEEASDCEFITFVDGDDTISTIYLVELCNAMNNDVEIVMCTCYSTEDKMYNPIGSYGGIKNIEIRKYIKKLICLDGGMPWGKLFRKKLFNEKTFDTPRKIVYGEDALMNIKIAFESKKNVKLINKPLYFYRQHSNGICSRFNHTAEYEELYREELLNTIPQSCFNDFSDAYVWRRIYFCRQNGSNEFKKPIWSNSKLHILLKKDIKKYKIDLPIFEKLLLYNTNVVSRILIILCRKAYYMFKL